MRFTLLLTIMLSLGITAAEAAKTTNNGSQSTGAGQAGSPSIPSAHAHRHHLAKRRLTEEVGRY